MIFIYVLSVSRNAPYGTEPRRHLRSKKITPTQERYNAMNYEQSIDYIHSIPKFRRPLGNANLEKLLTHLDNPQKKLKFIHIAGTNGKGSTAAMTAEILKKAVLKQDFLHLRILKYSMSAYE